MPLESSVRARSASSYQRRRAGNACLVCRSRKTKCDNRRPTCSFCAATGGECIYVDSDPSQFDRASLAILQRLGQLETTVLVKIEETFGRATSTESGQLRQIPPVSRQNGIGENGPPQQNPQVIGQSVSPNDRDRPALSERDLHVFESASTSLDDMPPSAAEIALSSWMVTESILKWPIFSQTAPHLITELHVPIIEVLGRSERSKRQWQHPTTRTTGTHLNLDSSVVDHLVENFLANNHVKNPVLDVQSLRADAREFAETGAQWDERSCLILILCAVSCLNCSLDEEIEPGPSKSAVKLASAETYFLASQRRIGILYHQNSLVAAQCTFLTAVYLMQTMQILAAWKCFVQASSQCLAWLTSQGRMKGKDATGEAKGGETALHQDLTLPASHAEDCLYWSCLKSELELRFELNLPGAGLNEMQYPHLFPSVPIGIHHASRSEEMLEAYWPSPQSWTSRNDQQHLELGWLFYLAEIALKRIVHDVMSWLCRLRSATVCGDRRKGDGYDLATGAIEFETRIQDWLNTLPPPMRFPAQKEQLDQPTRNVLRFILRGHMIDIREIVRLPAIHEILSSQLPFSAETFSNSTLRLGRELLENAVDRIRANREGWYHRHQGTWLMMRSCSRSALHLVGMALKCQQAAMVLHVDCQTLEQEILPSDWRDAVVQVIGLLEYWADESQDVERLSNILKELMHTYAVSFENGI